MDTEIKPYLFKTIKGSLIGAVMVPIIFLVLSTESETGFQLEQYLMLLRISVEIVVINIILSAALFIFLKKKNHFKLKALRSSLKFRITFGVFNLVIGLYLASLIEPYISGVSFNFKGFSTGFILGLISFMLILFFYAYKETQNYNFKLQAETALGQLKALNNQMQPHFLFNSLNSLAELIESNQNDASVMAIKLSDLYRKILQSSGLHDNSIKNEVEIVRLYLDLEKIRFGESLKYNIQIDPKAEHIRIPCLILQTLVENAIKHGISQSLKGGYIEILITEINSQFLVSIKNTVTDSSSNKGTGAGLLNTQSRLNLMYGSNHQFSFQILNDYAQAQFFIQGNLQ